MTNKIVLILFSLLPASAAIITAWIYAGYTAKDQRRRNIAIEFRSIANMMYQFSFHPYTINPNKEFIKREIQKMITDENEFKRRFNNIDSGDLTDSQIVKILWGVAYAIPLSDDMLFEIFDFLPGSVTSESSEYQTLVQFLNEYQQPPSDLVFEWQMKGLIT